jgi:formylglycine-generating enzyme
MNWRSPLTPRDVHRAVLGLLFSLNGAGCGAAEHHETLQPADGSAGSPGAGDQGQTEEGGTPAALPFRETLRVPGGTFPMGRGEADAYDFPDRTRPPPPEPERDATISEFYLDKYEATVARFRAFLADFDGMSLPAGAGAHPLIEGSGWNPAWVDDAPFQARDVLWDFGSSSAPTWTDEPEGNEDLPINNISWLVAFQFCVWDGGRLPTEAEWEYAAAGGEENRLFPWGSDPATAERANFGGAFGRSRNVGSHLAGAGRWGHLDLGGNLSEWAFDAHDTTSAEEWYSEPCNDCAWVGNWLVRVFKGGDFQSDEEWLRPASRRIYRRDSWSPDRGVRCARDAER